jgi:hypothetical protein
MYDISHLVAQGFIDADDDLVEAATTVHAGQYLSVGRTIILTEGRSDSSALSASLLLLYPHLADYYSFLDFDAFRVPGGSGSLANLTRAMAAAGVINRIIALFDNDTAGESAMRGLRSLNLPTNICLARLPDLEGLRAYPTLGPTGSTTMDVNGIAASIELYLGRDALTASDGKLVPVQWTGYDAGIGQYQGEIMRKREIQQAFEAKILDCRNDSTRVAAYDWTGLHAIWRFIFSRFHAVDGEMIRQAVTQYNTDN